MTPLHSAVKNLAGSKPALVLSHDALRGFLLNNFKNTVKRLKNVSVPIEGFPSVEARFTGMSVDPANFQVDLSDARGLVNATISPEFQFYIALHVAGDTQGEFSHIEINVTNLNVILTASAPNLILGAPDFDAQGIISVSSTRAAALAKAGITEEDVIRIEGAMAYIMPRRVVTSALSTVRSVNLAELFTAFELRGDWTLHIVNDGLIVIPSDGVVIRENTGCPLKDSVPDLSTKPEPRQEIDDTHYSWPITPGGFTASLVRSANDKFDGFAGLYAPKPIWDARFSKTMPAIVYRESDNGFIGYDLTFTAALKFASLRIDPARFGIVIDLDFVANGFAFTTVDVPCVGRSDLAYARFSCAPSNLSILLSFVLSRSGKLVLESQIDSLNIGKVEATVSGFSRWLALAGGKAAVVGFIIDYVLKRVIEHNVPIKMRDAIKQEVNSKNFKLLDLEGLAAFTTYGLFNEATFSGDNDSVLVGLMSNG
jgi:hypothetical protein